MKLAQRIQATGSFTLTSLHNACRGGSRARPKKQAIQTHIIRLNPSTLLPKAVRQSTPLAAPPFPDDNLPAKGFVGLASPSIDTNTVSGLARQLEPGPALPPLAWLLLLAGAAAARPPVGPAAARAEGRWLLPTLNLTAHCPAVASSAAESSRGSREGELGDGRSSGALAKEAATSEPTSCPATEGLSGYQAALQQWVLQSY